MKEILKILSALDQIGKNEEEEPLYSIEVFSDWSGNVQCDDNEIFSFGSKKECKSLLYDRLIKLSTKSND